jgi:hypothetical protein
LREVSSLKDHIVSRGGAISLFLLQQVVLCKEEDASGTKLGCSFDFVEDVTAS